MKYRVEKYKRYRNDILCSDDGDLPIAKSKGKHLKKDGNIVSSQVSYKRKIDKKLDEISKGKLLIYVLIVLLIVLILLGIFLSL